MLEQYDLVRIRRLLHPTDAAVYNGWGVNVRSPKVGDVGTVVDVLTALGLPLRYVVECSDDNGARQWLGEFQPEEIEAVPA